MRAALHYWVDLPAAMEMDIGNADEGSPAAARGETLMEETDGIEDDAFLDTFPKLVSEYGGTSAMN